jgi:UDP-N-acetylglucosamine acyltransferase
MPQSIHPSAVIDPAATLGADVQIGPFCVVGPHVRLGDRVRLRSHVVVDGHTEIGDDTEVFPFASIGTPPQDLKYGGEESRVIIGKRNKIREHVTINPGTAGGGMETRVGDNCLLMVGCHIAHDCIVGNHVIFANNATLAGHVIVGDHAIIGGLSAVHQFVRIGPHAMIGGMSGVENDVIPYGLVMGERANLSGLNLVGLDRRGFERALINELRQAFKIMFGTEDTFADRTRKASETYPDNQLVQDVIAFIQGDSSRSICQPKQPSRN